MTVRTLTFVEVRSRPFATGHLLLDPGFQYGGTNVQITLPSLAHRPCVSLSRRRNNSSADATDVLVPALFHPSLLIPPADQMTNLPNPNPKNVTPSKTCILPATMEPPFRLTLSNAPSW